jgi:hypothetical protein
MKHTIKISVVLYEIYSLLAIDDGKDIVAFRGQTLLKHPSIKYTIL